MPLIFKMGYKAGFEERVNQSNFNEMSIQDLLSKTYMMGYDSGFNARFFKGLDFLKDFYVPNLFEKIKKGKIELNLKISRDQISEEFKDKIIIEDQDKTNEKGKGSYRGIIPKAEFDYLLNEKVLANYKGLNPKHTRPYTNNDCGLLTPLQPEFLKRTQYVNFLNKDFRHFYKLFLKGFNEKRGFTKECFLYFDPPYPDKKDLSSDYYLYPFKKEDHLDLIDICLKSPFNILLSIGGYCRFYLDTFLEHDWIIIPISTSYSTNANYQDKVWEYAIMNYDIRKERLMLKDHEQKSIFKYIK